MRWVAAALVAMPAAAEVTLGDFPAVDTRFGRIQVSDVASGQQLYFGGAPVADVGDARVAILGAWALEGEPWDWVLVEVSHNGNMCPARLVILRASAGALARTGEFAGCLGRVDDVVVEPGRITVSVVDPDVSVAEQRFTFDGAQFTVTPVAAATAPRAGAGDDVLRWVGRSFQEVMDDASERARFLTILTPAQLEELRRRVALGEHGQRIGDWVYGTGCMPHQCNATTGLWAIRVSDGAPAAAFFDEGQRERWFGLGGAEVSDLLGPAARVRVP